MIPEQKILNRVVHHLVVAVSNDLIKTAIDNNLDDPIKGLPEDFYSSLITASINIANELLYLLADGQREEMNKISHDCRNIAQASVKQKHPIVIQRLYSAGLLHKTKYGYWEKQTTTIKEK